MSYTLLLLGSRRIDNANVYYHRYAQNVYILSLYWANTNSRGSLKYSVRV